MTNPYIEYYKNQAGSGFSPLVFQGYQYQRGHGFFSSIFQNILKPLGRYFGKQLLSTGINVGSDMLQGDNFKNSLLKNVKSTSKNILNDGISRAQKFAQTGKGRSKRRRRRKSKRSKAKQIDKKKRNSKRKVVAKKKTLKKRKTKSKSKSKFSHLFQ